MIECTGAPAVIAGVLARTAPDGIVCLPASAASHSARFDIGLFNRTMVLDNGVVFGTVNANRAALRDGRRRARARRPGWLDAPDHAPRAARALAPRRSSTGQDDIKVVIDFTLRGSHDRRRIEDYALIGDCETRGAGRAATARSTGCAGRASIPMPASRRCSARPSTAAG